MINLIVRTNKRTKPKPSFNLKKKKLSSTLTPSFTHNTASILLRLPSRGNKNLLHASTLLQTLNSNGIHRTSPFLDPNLVAGTHGVETHDSPRLFSNSHLNYVQFIAYSGRSFRNDGTTVWYHGCRCAASFKVSTSNCARVPSWCIQFTVAETLHPCRSLNCPERCATTEMKMERSLQRFGGCVLFLLSLGKSLDTSKSVYFNYFMIQCSPWLPRC